MSPAHEPPFFPAPFPDPASARPSSLPETPAPCKRPAAEAILVSFFSPPSCFSWLLPPSDLFQILQHPQPVFLLRRFPAVRRPGSPAPGVPPVSDNFFPSIYPKIALTASFGSPFRNSRRLFKEPANRLQHARAARSNSARKRMPSTTATAIQ